MAFRGGKKNRYPYQSEFAETEARGHDPILVSSQHQPDNMSITMREMMASASVSGSMQGKAIRKQATNESVTDTHAVMNTQMQFAPTALDQSLAGHNMATHMSVTEMAVSQMGSINARRSECVNLDPFEEEKSTDWNKPKAQPVPQQPEVIQTSQPPNEPQFKSKFSLQSERKSIFKKEDELSSTNKDDNYSRLATGQRINKVEINNDVSDYCLEVD